MVTVKLMFRSQGEKVGESSPAVVKSEIPKSQTTGEDASTFPQKDLETVVGISTPAVVKKSPSLVDSEAEAAKKQLSGLALSKRSKSSLPKWPRLLPLIRYLYIFKVL